MYERPTAVPPARKRAPVEAKVKASSVVTYLGVVTLLAVLAEVDHLDLVTALPQWAEVILTPLLPALATFGAGYQTRHTPRPTE